MAHIRTINPFGNVNLAVLSSGEGDDYAERSFLFKQGKKGESIRRTTIAVEAMLADWVVSAASVEDAVKFLTDVYSL